MRHAELPLEEGDPGRYKIDHALLGESTGQRVHVSVAVVLDDFRVVDKSSGLPLPVDSRLASPIRLRRPIHSKKNHPVGSVAVDTQLVRSRLGTMSELENVPDPTLSYAGRLDLDVEVRPWRSRRPPLSFGGVPVVASSSSSLGELLHGAALLCDPACPDEFAQALARVLTDTNERERLVKAGHDRAAQFTWRRAAERTVAVDEQVS